MSHGTRPPRKWNEASVNKIINDYVTGSVKVCQDFHRLQGVYGVLGFFYEPSLYVLM